MALYEDFHPDTYHETYFAAGSPFLQDALGPSWQDLHKAFSSGAVKGDTLIDIGTATNICSLIAACDSFKEIIVTDVVDRCCEELEKWRKGEPGSIDWSASLKLVCEFEGSRDTWVEKEEKLRSTIKQVLKCDVTKCNPLAPVSLPQVDCVLVSYTLECACNEMDTFYAALKNVSTLLKVGGHLLLLICFGCTFYMVGEYKFPTLCVDKDTVEKALCDNGFVIEKLKESKRLLHGLYTVSDYESVAFFMARKEKDM